MDEAREFRMPRRRLFPLALVAFFTLAGVMPALLRHPDWRIAAIVTVLILGDFVYAYFILTYRLRIDNNGIRSDWFLRRKSLDWHRISGLHEVGTGAGGKMVARHGLELVGSTPSGKRMKITVPALSKADLDLVKQTVLSRMPSRR